MNPDGQRAGLRRRRREARDAWKVYYHNGLDIGGAEGLVEVIAATDGIVVSSGTARMTGHDDSPARPRYDVVYLLDDRGWYYRYSHMQGDRPGHRARRCPSVWVRSRHSRQGRGSGGWSHLHFEIASRQPSGRRGTQEGYAFLWQAYLREHKPEIQAVARPHRLARTGDTVTLDGSKSWSRSGRSCASNGPSATARPRTGRKHCGRTIARDRTASTR